MLPLSLASAAREAASRRSTPSSRGASTNEGHEAASTRLTHRRPAGSNPATSARLPEPTSPSILRRLMISAFFSWELVFKMSTLYRRRCKQPGRRMHQRIRVPREVVEQAEPAYHHSPTHLDARYDLTAAARQPRFRCPQVHGSTRTGGQGHLGLFQHSPAHVM